MKSISLYGIALFILIASCNNKRITVSILQPANLASTFISLNVDSSYTLKTPKGAIIKIAKNSFDVPANTTVKIEVKEAYTMQDILLAGLTTKSNGRLLQSGGMIYFNASANGNNVKITKPISIGIPTSNYNDSMQLFKGEIKADSTINWVDPTPLDSNDVSKELALGKTLFQGNCANCHKPTEDFTGPALAGARKREPKPEWAYHFINNVNTMAYTDRYAIRLKQKFGSLMTQQHLTVVEIKAVLDYCDNEALANPLRMDSSIISDSTKEENGYADNAADFPALTMPPCGYDTIYTPMQDSGIQIIPNDAIDTSATYNYIPTPDVSTPGIYQFNIAQCGWYNIDCFVDNNQKLVTNVLLSATVNTQALDSMNVYLCIPSRRLMAGGTNKESVFTFDYNFTNDTIPLILSDEAMIIVIGRVNNKMYYGVTKFVVTKEQAIAVKIKESTKEDINKSIHANRLDSTIIDEQVTVPVVTSISDTISDSSFNIRYDTTKTGQIMKIVPMYDCSLQ
jgi:mono/diheme cytochrome c family protein